MKGYGIQYETLDGIRTLYFIHRLIRLRASSEHKHRFCYRSNSNVGGGGNTRAYG